MLAVETQLDNLKPLSFAYLFIFMGSNALQTYDTVDEPGATKHERV